MKLTLGVKPGLLVLQRLSEPEDKARIFDASAPVMLASPWGATSVKFDPYFLLPFIEITMSIRKFSRPRRRRSTRFDRWQLTELERREMLAADAGAAVDSAYLGATDPAGQSSDLSLVEHHQSIAHSDAHLVIVDSAVAASDVWQSAVPEDSELVLLVEGRNPIDQITEILAGRQNLESVHLISHGKSGELWMGGEAWTKQSLMQRGADIQRWGSSMAPGADLLIYGCDFASGHAGQQLALALADLINVDVAASIDRTGAIDRNADWQLEFQVGSIEHADLLRPHALQRYKGHLGIEIWAAGQTTDELMELEINGQIVDTWFVRNTDADSGQFLPYFYNVDGISADSVRINFVNDLYDPQNGIDRNLRIDRLVIDGVTYETEHPSVFSTGTWKPEDGVTPGFRQSEYLSSNGYFQFSSNGGSPGGGSGSRIDIEAAGDTGDEAIELLIDENVVATYLNISTSETTYTYFAGQNVTADRVRVQFIGSVYEPQNNYDQNVRVDRIVIDGVGFESEAASTFSTGTYVSGQGIVPGNWQSEYLHADGYFQYAGGGTGGNPGGGGGNAGNFSLASGAVTVVEGQDSVTVRVERIGGSDGNASIDIFTAGETAGAGQDFVEKADRLFFGDGETVKTFTVNLLNDGIAEATEEFSIRLDNPAGAGLLAPRTSLITILDDDSGLPRYDSFSTAAGLSLNGNANVNGGELELTSAGNRQAGTAFYQSSIAVNASTSFQSAFSFRIGGGVGTAGADGFTFLLQNSSQGPNALGRAGGHMAYDNINNSLAVEFDNYLKGDVGASTIAVVIDGNTANPILEVPAPFDLNNGTQYYAWVDYNGDSNNLAVYVSTDSQKPSLALLKTNVDLAQIVGNSAYAGFTAGNFDLPNYHRIGSWNFSLDAPPADPPVIPSGIIAEQDIYSGLNQPLSVDWSADGRNIYIGEKGGVIKVARDGSSNLQTLIDISAQVNNVSDRGMVDFALHPDFLNNGYVYLLYTYDPPEVFNHVGNPLAGPDGTGNRAGRLLRVQADASTGFTTIVPGSETVLLGTNSTWNNFNAFTDSTTDFNEPEAGRTAGGGYVRDFIKSDSLSHTVGSLAFGLDGSLFVSIGDGASYNRTDVRALSVQNIDSLSGKVLRIDPFTGRGYSDNPFYNGDTNANRSKVYQLGLRNPWRLTVDPRTGQLYIGETGLASFEEINTGGPGENFGWPFYEGSQGVNNRTPGYQSLPQAAAFYASGQGKPASIALEHRAGSNVVVLGDVVYDNNLGTQYEGDLFFADLYRGSVGHANIGANGEPFAAETFVTGAEFVVDIRQGPDGSLYYVNLLEGTVGRWVVV